MLTMYRLLRVAIAALLASSRETEAAEIGIWIERAAMNPDPAFLGIPEGGLARAYTLLMLVLNLAVFGVLLQVVAKEEVDWAALPWAYPSIAIGGLLLALLLNPVLRAGSIVAVIAFEVFGLIRFFQISPRRAFLAALVFRLYHAASIMALRGLLGEP